MSMELSTIAEVRLALRQMQRKAWMEIAEESGVPPSTVEKIAYGVTTNPKLDTFEPLRAAVQKRLAS